ncbi:MAG: YHS domain-containing (seleno)protein [Flavobacteriales bacterium]
MTSKFFVTVVAAIAMLQQQSVAQWQLRKAQFNNENALALQGYDPVAYFTQGKAVKGSSAYSVNVDGLIYQCSTAVNKQLLEKDPKKYEPQYGGWCAYAMGNMGEKVDVNPETFKIVDDKLYLFYNAYFNNTLIDWNKNETSLKQKADVNWKKFFNP